MANRHQLVKEQAVPLRATKLLSVSMSEQANRYRSSTHFRGCTALLSSSMGIAYREIHVEAIIGSGIFIPSHTVHDKLVILAILSSC